MGHCHWTIHSVCGLLHLLLLQHVGMSQEIERKFLVNGDDYKRQAFAHIPIVQGYICRQAGRSARVRIAGDKGILTIKGPSLDGGLSRYEWNKEIPVEEARELLELATGPLIEKTRHLVKSGKHTFEVDEFFGKNEGLVIAEVELEYEEEPYEKLDFVGQEVTGDPRYYNSHLAQYPYCMWRSD